MLTYRSTQPYFLAILAATTAGLALSYWGVQVPITVVLLYLTLLAYGSFRPQMGFYIPHKSHGVQGTLALTYDDGPSLDHTPALLDVLREENVKATFFCIGERVLRHPEIARRIVADGHTIAVHTMTHPWSWGFLGRTKALQQITECYAAILRVTGTRPTLFRPPYGVTSPATARAIQQSGLVPMAWDLRTFDTMMDSSASGQADVLRRTDRATIVLMHDPLPAALVLTKAIIHKARRNRVPLVPL